MSDDHGPELDEDAIDRLGRDAGAQLRRPAPDSGAQQIAATARRRHTTRSAVTAGLGLAVFVGVGTVIVLARRPSDSINTNPSIPTVAPSPTSPMSAAPTVPPSTAATTSSIPTSTTTPDRPPQVAQASYLSPPPELTLRALASLAVPEPTVGSYSVAVGDLGIAVGSSNYGDLAPVRIDIVGFDGQVRSLNGPAGTAGGSVSIIAYGPGDVAYASRPGDSIEDFSVVALALSGPNAGDVVASTPQNVNRFLEYPRSSFGHSASGIADRRPGGLELTTSTPYVDVDGDPAQLDATPPWFTLESPEPGESSHGGVVTSSTGASWSLEVEAAPDRASPYEGNSPPAAGPNGSGVYWTHIGPDATPEQDFGEPTTWVIAEMRPDGSATWWSLPDGWQVLASDLWGTVLGRQQGTELQLALADFGSELADPEAGGWAASDFEPGATWLGYSGNWSGDGPSPAAPADGQAPHDGYYVASVLEPWTPERPDVLSVRIQRLEWCSVLADGCELMEPDEMNLDPRWHLDVDLTLDTTTKVVVGGFRCFEDDEGKQATGTELAELFAAFTTDYQAEIAPHLAERDDAAVAADVAARSPGGFVSEETLGCESGTASPLRYQHDDSPMLLLQVLRDSNSSRLDATDLVALEGVRYANGSPIFYFYAGFRS